MSILSAAATADTIETKAHRFEELADGVYLVVGNGTVFVQSNSLVVVNDDHVVLVDSHVTAAAGRALRDSIREITDLPIKYLVNSHYHFDHAHGNQVFDDESIVVGHEYTRQRLLGNVLEEATYVSFTSDYPDRVAELKKRVEGETDSGRKEALEQQLAVTAAHADALGEVVPTPPEVTVSERMTLFENGREIQLHHLGRGHTGGDVVVVLPKERVAFTGDLMLPFLSYMGDGYADEWVATLEKLKQLDVDVFVPGHGAPFRERERITNFQAYLEDIWTQTAELKAGGKTVQEAAEAVDLTAHSKAFPQIREPGADIRAVARIYQLIDQRQ